VAVCFSLLLSGLYRRISSTATGKKASGLSPTLPTVPLIRRASAMQAEAYRHRPPGNLALKIHKKKAPGTEVPRAFVFSGIK